MQKRARTMGVTAVPADTAMQGVPSALENGSEKA